jgi:hypothetical protein
MAYARIYSPSKTAMQSGKAKTGEWILQYDTCEDQFEDPVMGWTGSTSTLNQVTFYFDTLGEAISFSLERGLDFRLYSNTEKPNLDPPQKKSYADNFRHNKPPLS